MISNLLQNTPKLPSGQHRHTSNNQPQQHNPSTLPDHLRTAEMTSRPSSVKHRLHGNTMTGVSPPFFAVALIPQILKTPPQC